MVNAGFGFRVGRQATTGLPAGCAWPILTRSRNPLDIARFRRTAPRLLPRSLV